jgi:hypothetical protein
MQQWSMFNVRSALSSPNPNFSKPEVKETGLVGIIKLQTTKTSISLKETNSSDA